MTQTVEVPASHRLTIDVPREIPPGQVILTFTPAVDQRSEHEGECPICAAHRDPVTGEERFNAKTIAAIEEGRAMMRGEIPSKLYTSTDEMWEDLMSETDDAARTVTFHHTGSHSDLY
jgi:hypothetical protein